jgi:NADH:ubiquinone oxidoreductase subunit 6 (subunit J)
LIRIVFGLVSTLGLVMALGTVLARNLVHAALFLVAFFFVIACQFVMLEAEFLAAVQVLVYIGAVAIILMFGIMLTRNIQGDETTIVRWPARLPAAVAGLGVLLVLLYGIMDQAGLRDNPSWSGTLARRPIPVANDAKNPPLANAAVNDMGRTIGREMMTRFVVPFEVAGLLLTAALVGAVALARQEGASEGETPREGALAAVRPGTTPGPGQGNGHAPAAGAPKPETLLTTAPEPR